MIEEPPVPRCLSTFTDPWGKTWSCGHPWGHNGADGKILHEAWIPMPMRAVVGGLLGSHGCFRWSPSEADEAH